MKELSIREKAKRYDELKVTAQELEHDGCFDKITLFDLFPELAESEDERIRKELISIVTWSTSYSASGVTKEDADNLIAWIEKQGEQKPKRMISAEAKEAMYDRPAWNEEDQSKIRHLIAYLEKGPDTVIMSRPKDEWIDFLKSLKDRVQPKQEWSDKDEATFTVIGSLILDNFSAEDASETLTWLHSLRPNHWKPDEMDIELLESVISGKSDPKDFQTSLQGLLENLKSL